MVVGAAVVTGAVVVEDPASIVGPVMAGSVVCVVGFPLNKFDPIPNKRTISITATENMGHHVGSWSCVAALLNLSFACCCRDGISYSLL